MKNKNSMTVATQKEQESKGFFKLSWFERIAFGSGDMAQNFIYQTVTTYLLFFYTNVYGLNPAIASAMFLGVRIIDAIWDPIVGVFVDKTSTRFGKYRGWLLRITSYNVCYTKLLRAE